MQLWPLPKPKDILATMVEQDTDFDDASPPGERVNIQSTWRSTQAGTVATGMTTEPLQQDDAMCQTTERAQVAVQTDGEGTGIQTAPSKAADKSHGLAAFLQRVEPLMVAQMHSGVEEHELLEPLQRSHDNDEEAPEVLHYLSAFRNPVDVVDGELAAGTNKHSLVVTAVSWSSTGQTIAASYGRYDIVGWCTYPGQLVTWNLGREEVNPNKPDVRIEVDNCLMACAFHPAHPALIAGGTFNGELYVWDLSQEGDFQRAKSNVLCDVRHTEPIVSITWQYSRTEDGKYGNKAQAYRLVTLSADGRVLIWVWHKLGLPLFAYQLLWPQPHSDRKVLWGGTCMSFQRDVKVQDGSTTFLVGTEGGKVFKCYLDMNDISAKEWGRALAAGEKPDLRCPIKDITYDEHAGSVFGLDCSPFQRELFLSSGADGSVRLFSALREQALMVMEPSNTYLYAAQWSPFRPLVFATAAGDGRVYIYDLLRAKGLLKPVCALDVSGGVAAPVYAMAFNQRKAGSFATGDASGVQIWKLPSSLSGIRRGEEALLRQIAATDDVEELLRGKGLR